MDRRWRTVAALGRAALGVGLALMLPACGPPTLDPSSLERLDRSLTRLREPMTPAELSRFDEAVGYLVGPIEPAVLEIVPRQAAAALDRCRPLKGLTAEGIVAEARYRRIRQVRSAVALLESLRAESLAARRELSQFRCSVARVFKRHRDYLDWPVIEIVVDNGTPYTVALVHFRASLLSPIDEAPWIFEEFDHVAFGGLAAGAHDTWRVEPRQREWIQLVDPHPRVSFSLEVMRLEALGGRVLVGTEWGGIEENRLAIYRATLDTIRRSDTLALDSPPLATVPALGDRSDSR